MEELGDTLTETQTALQDLEQKYAYEKQSWEDSSKYLKSNMSLNKNQVSELQANIEQAKKANLDKIEMLEN